MGRADSPTGAAIIRWRFDPFSASRRNRMASRVLLIACLVGLGLFMTDARAQTPPPGAASTTQAPAKAETKQQIRAAKKAERVATRKKRAQCYDQAKKQSLAGQQLVSFLESC